MMAKVEGLASSRPGFEWLYPDLLTKADLVKTLNQRYIKECDLEKLEKDELVELYNKYIIPLPQRKYRLNRRGRDMTVKQVKQAKKRRAVITMEDNPPPEKRRSSGKLLSSFEQSVPAGDRLKPPPACVDFNKKTIKLGSSVKSSSSSESVTPVSSSLNKLKLTKSESSSPKEGNSEKSPPKKIKLNNCTTGDSVAGCKLKDKADDELEQKEEKVDSKVLNVNKSEEKMDTSDSGTEEKKETKKKKLIKISWP